MIFFLFLTMVQLSNNEISCLPPGLFNNQTNLESLYVCISNSALSTQLHQNKIQSLPLGIFQTLTKLLHLDVCLLSHQLRNNSLEAIRSTPFPQQSSQI